MQDTLARLSDNKVITIVGLVLAGLSAICLSQPEEIAATFPDWGVWVCELVALIGVVLAALGKGVGERRTSEGRKDLLAAALTPMGTTTSALRTGTP